MLYQNLRTNIFSCMSKVFPILRKYKGIFHSCTFQMFFQNMWGSVIECGIFESLLNNSIRILDVVMIDRIVHVENQYAQRCFRSSSSYSKFLNMKIMTICLSYIPRPACCHNDDIDMGKFEWRVTSILPISIPSSNALVAITEHKFPLKSLVSISLRIRHFFHLAFS